MIQNGIENTIKLANKSIAKVECFFSFLLLFSQKDSFVIYKVQKQSFPFDKVFSSDLNEKKKKLLTQFQVINGLRIEVTFMLRQKE